MIIIDQEHVLDAPQIEMLLDTTFGLGRKSKSSYSLRENIDPIHDLSFVLRSNNVVLGTIRFWPAVIHDVLGGSDQQTLFLGPLAIHPDVQGTGYGKMLVDAALAKVDELSFSRVMLVGCTKYYGKFGFRSVKPKYISLPGNRDAERLLVRENGSVRSLPSLGRLIASDGLHGNCMDGRMSDNEQPLYVG
ncbi:GNAT family N-acetyltransferase [Kordiimonas sp. SCSIO 12610]|uniref:GNAT family N-acetyltransferase n=1 Tax=Kordiimonas sp. SCSIO 12610 TaxID=2829597 RepID=UPI00210B5367|nr:N-acetyltransferase [Kordiimonas sp. SCSIO 12610]UTW54460.1 N-acetyltransferase [Kordiimonas sp. SCSIO 12610]